VQIATYLFVIVFIFIEAPAAAASTTKPRPLGPKRPTTTIKPAVPAGEFKILINFF